MDDDAIRVLPCPVCGEVMDHQKRSGVAVDVCGDHGIWLDGRELETIIARIRGRMTGMRRRALRAARRDGKVQGAMMGWWALLGD